MAAYSVNPRKLARRPEGANSLVTWRGQGAWRMMVHSTVVQRTKVARSLELGTAAAFFYARSCAPFDYVVEPPGFQK